MVIGLTDDNALMRELPKNLVWAGWVAGRGLRLGSRSGPSWKWDLARTAHDAGTSCPDRRETGYPDRTQAWYDDSRHCADLTMKKMPFTAFFRGLALLVRTAATVDSLSSAR
jgi:hypothetical protein